MVPRASTRDAGSLVVASWETTPQENTRNSVAPARACEEWPRVTVRMSPASPANRPLAAKAARVPAAAGMGSLAERDRLGWFAVVARGAGVPVSGTNHRPARPTAPRARNTR